MKPLTLLILAIVSIYSYSQTQFDTLLLQGKEEFHKEFEAQDYANAVAKLAQAVALKPDNAEAHYFLGYAYSRVNSKDGKGMIAMSRELTLKASEQLELINKLTPKYEGEVVLLDPYSKLTSEWGSLAMSYWHNNHPDSALWAFKEGKKRGGFGELYLSVNRKALDSCTPNAILISSGDNMTIPLWYLQIVENYRTDVSVIDISLLNTSWYPRYLVEKGSLSFGVSTQELDSLQHTQWTDSVMTINVSAQSSFSWTLKPSYKKKYLLRSDRLFLHLLMANKFKRDLFFTRGFNEENRLSLGDKLMSLVAIDRLNVDRQPELTFKEYTAKLELVVDCLKFLNPNSQQELIYVDYVRFDLFLRIYNCLENEDNQQAKSLLKLADKQISPTDYPFQSESSTKFYNYLKQRIHKENL